MFSIHDGLPQSPVGQETIVGQDRASQACRQCSRLKRKCQRELPSCSLCIRLEKPCEYPSARKPYGSSHSRDEQFSPSVASITSSVSYESSNFPDAFFLDTDLFNPVSHATLRKTTQPVPVEVSQLLGSDASAICEHYFSSTDSWFPFIGRKRLNQGIQAGVPTEISGLSLTLLCMRLVTDAPNLSTIPANSSTLYRTARSYLNTIEETSPVSLYVFQALVLIALYEIGHGIYPAAYLTVGRAARLGILMGIQDRKHKTQLFSIPHTWTYWEEERRTWWAVLILERYLNLGPTGLRLATPEPLQGDLLPSADPSWSQGVIGTNQPLYTTGFSSHCEIGPFARTCQASHILGRVINHKNRRPEDMDRNFLLEEALQLSATLTALDTHLGRAMDEGQNNENITVVDVALCTSARWRLYQLYACVAPDATTERLPTESTMQTECIAGMKQIAATRAPMLAWHILRQGTDRIERSSPLILQCLYDTASECQWLVREENVEGADSTLQVCKEALATLASRWDVARKYLQLLKQDEEKHS